jgi:hypothetical protein
MRDGVVLRADVLRPSGPGRFPVLVYRTPYDRADAADATGLAKKAVQRGYAVVAAGCAGPLWLRWDLHRLQPGRQRRIRYDRVGGATAVVQRRRRQLRSFLSGRGPMARRGGAPAVAQGDGARDDLRYSPRPSGTRAACGMGRGSTGPGSTSRRTCDVASAFLEHRPQSKPRLNGRPTATGSATTGHCPLCLTSKVLPRGTTNGCAIRRETRGGSGQPSKASTPPSAPRCSTSLGGSMNRMGPSGR